MSNPSNDPFLMRLTAVLSAYEAGGNGAALHYDGPANEQMHSVLRSLDVIAGRMQAAEGKLRAIGVEIDMLLPGAGLRTGRGDATEPSTTNLAMLLVDEPTLRTPLSTRPEMAWTLSMDCDRYDRRCCHGSPRAFPLQEGVWADVLTVLLKLQGDFTNTIRGACEVLKAVAFGDLSRTLTVDVHGELLDFKHTVNGIVGELRKKTARISEDASQAGVEF